MSYLLSFSTVLRACRTDSLVILLKWSVTAKPSETYERTLPSWSPNNGIPTMGTPLWTASIVPISPPWVRNAFTFLWPERRYRTPGTINLILIPLLARRRYYSFALGWGRDSSVGIATRYGLDGPGIESRWGRDFPHPSRPSVGPTQPHVQWVHVVPGGKAAGAWCWTPTPSNAEVEGRVELYIYSLLGLRGLF